MICLQGVRALTVRAVHTEPSIWADPHPYVNFEYEDGKVFDQWTGMRRRDGNEPMVDVLKLAFQKKLVTDAVWQANEPEPRQRKSAGRRDP
jgi:hypothetical protein